MVGVLFVSLVTCCKTGEILGKLSSLISLDLNLDIFPISWNVKAQENTLWNFKFYVELK